MFITLLGGAAAAWPLAARAQQPGRVWRIGVLFGIAKNDPEGRNRIDALRQGLEKLGWLLGQNLQIESRWAGGDLERLKAQAAELVRLKPDVLVAGATVSLVALPVPVSSQVWRDPCLIRQRVGRRSQIRRHSPATVPSASSPPLH